MTKHIIEEHMELYKISVVKCSACWKINLRLRCNKLVKEWVMQATDSIQEYILTASLWYELKLYKYNCRFQKAALTFT